MLGLLAFYACSWSSAPSPSSPSEMPEGPPEADRPAERAPPVEVRGGGLFRPLPPSLTAEQQARIEALESLGYTDGEVEAPTVAGVTVHDPARTHPGLNLWCSGHAPEAYLMQADGTVVHTWRRTWRESFGDAQVRGRRRGIRYWRHVALLEDRGLLAIFEGHGMVKLDADSNVVWTLRERIHHDVEVLPDGRLLTLARKGRVDPPYDPDAPALDDRILVLSADGAIERDVSLLDALRRSEWGTWLEEAAAQAPDLLHTNSVQWLSEPVAEVDALAPGRVVVSMRTIHAIAAVDLDDSRVVWAVRGPWRGQHDAQVLKSGRLLLFDNFGVNNGRASAIRELVPAELQEVWTYVGSEAEPFSSPFFGAVQRLGNGNTLITDSWVGRALEVTPSGETVWSFVNPHQLDPEGDEGPYIAVLPLMRRVGG